MGSLLEIAVPNTLLSDALTDLDRLPDQVDKRVEQALDEVGAAALQNIRVNFLVERDPRGNPWIPSKAGTLRKANRKGRTLFDTGRLFHSIQLYNDGPGERHIGTDVPYAPFLQFGTKYMPARVFIDFPDRFEDVATSIFRLRVTEDL